MQDLQEAVILSIISHLVLIRQWYTIYQFGSEIVSPAVRV